MKKPGSFRQPAGPGTQRPSSTRLRTHRQVRHLKGRFIFHEGRDLLDLRRPVDIG